MSDMSGVNFAQYSLQRVKMYLRDKDFEFQKRHIHLIIYVLPC